MVILVERIRGPGKGAPFSGYELNIYTPDFCSPKENGDLDGYSIASTNKDERMFTSFISNSFVSDFAATSIY